MKNILLFFFLSVTVLAVDPNTPKQYEYRLYGCRSGFELFTHISPMTVKINGHVFFKDVKTEHFTPEICLTWLALNWLNKEHGTPTTMNEYSVFAKYYHPWIIPVIVDPNVPPVELPKGWTALNSKVFHLNVACPYWRDTMVEMDVFTLLGMDKRICTWCAGHEEDGTSN